MEEGHNYLNDRQSLVGQTRGLDLQEVEEMDIRNAVSRYKPDRESIRVLLNIYNQIKARIKMWLLSLQNLLSLAQFLDLRQFSDLESID